MGENTAIEWATHTFNPWEGCQKVGPGCDNCYAETRNARFSGGVAINWGPGAPRRRTSLANWQKPLRWNAEAARTGVRPRVFCASLADVFDNAVRSEWRRDFAALIRATPNLDWLLLTKRIGNAPDMLAEMFEFDIPENVFVGATIVNQAEWDRDVWKIAQVAVIIGKRRVFLSMEPLLGPVYLHRSAYSFPGIVGWVIVGGESGPRARAMHPKWARIIRDQCRADGVAFLFKQWGEWAPSTPEKAYANPRSGWRMFRGHPALPAAAELYPEAGAEFIEHVGKKAAGRLLDGVQHDGVPA